ncbi:TPA: ATP-dependent helicase [Candidatus Saccharibacteria bacterium]|nr:ATP-dependent helicase [Candidatus Saccharibacteria bacterium]HIO87570.1 ATP-dependent helicase [Candidatus Saccharibacteria bacterium]
MSDNFTNRYNGLNAKQKEAVDYIDGALMVLAGPGTGKTELLSMRAANILQTTDTHPSSILCLTFTDKASLNMQQRLQEIIGFTARNIQVRTFHSFSADVINQNPEYFFNHALVEPADDVIQLQIINNILEELPFQSRLTSKYGGKFTQIKRIIRSIDQAKKAGLTPEKLRSVAALNIAYIDSISDRFDQVFSKRFNKNTANEIHQFLDEIPTLETKTHPIRGYDEVLHSSLAAVLVEADENNTTKPLSAWKSAHSQVVDGKRVLKDVKRSLWWLELADVYQQYQSALEEQGYYDFSDMVLSVITELEQNETLRHAVAEQFNYVMVDEFQDTNDAQMRLVNLIVELQANNPNIMVVGDDDQAIYRFQGAEISNAQNFLDTFTHTKIISLTENYRSSSKLINSSQTIASKILHRLSAQLDIPKKIEAKFNTTTDKVEHKSYSTLDVSYVSIAQSIEHDYKAGLSVAVLARNHSSLAKIAAVLDECNVPLQYDRQSNVFELPGIQLLINVLKTVASIQKGDIQQSTYLLRTILPSDVVGLDSKFLWSFSIRNRYEDWVSAALASENEDLLSFVEWLVELAKLERNTSISILLEYILGLKPLGSYVSPLKKLVDSAEDFEAMQLLSGVQKLRSLASSSLKSSSNNLQSFVELLRSYEDLDLQISNELTFLNGDSFVNLMTVHKSKGLEFDSVFVLDAVDSIWSPSRSRNKTPINLEMMQEYGEDPDDYARLLYVAATRAKSRLVFVSYKTDAAGKAQLPSPLLADIPPTDITSTKQVLHQSLLRANTWPRLNHTDEKLLLKPLLTNYELSVTHLINFLDIENGGPQLFIERNLLRLPDVKSPHMGYGTAIHAALRLLQLQFNKQSVQLDLVLDEFDSVLETQHLEQPAFIKYRQKGRELLEKYVKNPDLLTLIEGAQPERSIKAVKIGDATIGGQIDRLDELQSELVVVDYKTGSPLAPELGAKTKTHGIKAFKHRLQLIFYSLLLEDYAAQKHKSIKGRMVYVEAQSDKDLVREYIPSHVEKDQLKLLIDVVWGKIQAFEWPEVSGYEESFEGMKQFITDLIGENQII